MFHDQSESETARGGLRANCRKTIRFVGNSSQGVQAKNLTVKSYLASMYRRQYMSDITEKSNYELAFHLSPNTEESALEQARQELEGYIAEAGGSIGYVRKPERTHLSYPIKKNSNSFFAYVHFSMVDKDGLVKVEDKLKLDTRVLRYLLLKTESDAEKAKSIARKAKSSIRRERRTEKQPVKKATEQEKKEIDEKLEKLIEDL